MSKKVKCPHCRHDGQRAMGGFQYEPCWDCRGEGYVYVQESSLDKKNADQDQDLANNEPSLDDIKLDKRSKEYKEAIKALQDKGLSKKEAEALFAEEWNKKVEDNT